MKKQVIVILVCAGFFVVVASLYFSFPASKLSLPERGSSQASKPCSILDLPWEAREFFELASKASSVDCKTFVKFNNIYAKDVHSVFVILYSATTSSRIALVLKSADASSFTSRVWAPWGTDKTSVYFGEEFIPNADPETFFHIDPQNETPSYFSYFYYRDIHSMYAVSSDWRHIEKIMDADMETFTLVGNGTFAKDTKHVYLFGEIIPNVSTDSFVFVGGDLYKDAKTIFRYDYEKKRLVTAMKEWDAGTLRIPAIPWADGVSPTYTIDKSGVYFKDMLMVGADPKTFALFDPKERSDGYGGSLGDTKRYAHDTTHVYYENKLVSSADPKTFHALDSNFYDEFGSDASHVFYLGVMIEGADPKTFVSLTWQPKEGCSPAPYSKDEVHVFLDTRTVEGADPKTFEAFQEGRYGKDKDHIYDGDKMHPDLDVKTFHYSCGYG